MLNLVNRKAEERIRRLYGRRKGYKRRGPYRGRIKIGLPTDQTRKSRKYQKVLTIMILSASFLSEVK